MLENILSRIYVSSSLEDDNNVYLPRLTEWSNFLLTPARYLLGGRDVSLFCSYQPYYDEAPNGKLSLRSESPQGYYCISKITPESFSHEGGRSWMKCALMLVASPASIVGVVMRLIDMFWNKGLYEEVSETSFNSNLEQLDALLCNKTTLDRHEKKINGLELLVDSVSQEDNDSEVFSKGGDDFESNGESKVPFVMGPSSPSVGFVPLNPMNPLSKSVHDYFLQNFRGSPPNVVFEQQQPSSSLRLESFQEDSDRVFDDFESHGEPKVPFAMGASSPPSSLVSSSRVKSFPQSRDRSGEKTYHISSKESGDVRTITISQGHDKTVFQLKGKNGLPHNLLDIATMDITKTGLKISGLDLAVDELSKYVKIKIYDVHQPL